MPDGQPHILVVDDDTRLRDLLRRYLVENGFMVTAAKDAAEARARLGAFEVDLMVLDVMMPGESGLELTRSLREATDLPILLLTARGEPEDRIAGLEAGADDYLPKPFDPRELLLRISSILRRVPRPPAAPARVRLGALVFDLDRDELTEDGRAVRLTQAETILLRVLAAAPGEVFAREALVERTGLNGGERAVDVQVTRLRRKVEPDPREPRYLVTVRGEGYVLRPDG